MQCSRNKIRNQPIDGGFLLLDKIEKDKIIFKEPESEKFIRKYVGSQEFIHNEERYCLWLKDAAPDEINNLPLVKEKIAKVSEFRLSSKREETKKLAKTSSLFAFVSHEESDYIYLSFLKINIFNRFYEKDIIASNAWAIPNASLYNFEF